MTWRNTYNRLLLLSVALCAWTAVMAEAVGTWKIFPSYQTISNVCPAGNKVYVQADGNLYSYNTQTSEVREYNRSTTPALNSTEITHVAWVKATNKLVIVYADYLIDILSASDDISFIAGLRDASTHKDKTVEGLSVKGKYVYVKTGLGTLLIDTQDEYIVKRYNVEEDLTEELSTADVVNTQSGTYGTLYYDDVNRCWWGPDAEGKLTKYVEGENGMMTASSGIKPDSPATNSVWRLYKHDGKLFVTSGNFSSGMSSELMMQPGMVQYYDGNAWTTLPSPGRMTGYDYVAANCMAFDPKDKNHFYVGARSGLYEYRDYKPVNAFNSQNSALSPLYNTNTENSVVTSMIYDADNNLWVMNGWCDNFLVKFSGNNESVNYPHAQYTFDNRTSIDLQGNMFASATGKMYFVNTFYDIPVLYCYDTAHDNLSAITSFVNDDGADMAPIYLYNTKEDNDGNVWIASSAGPFYWGRDDVLSDTQTFVQHKISRNDGSDLADYLLKNVSVRCIEIDAAGRKWFGTSGSGVYLISSDNNTELEHFTTENSLLPSDQIYDILVDGETGTVWFATSKGLCSYQSDVTESYGQLTEDNVYAYPNPVTPDYMGDITIMGLIDGYQVTITNASGYVVHRGICSGGSYKWNGCDQNGDRVASGVYMVLVTTNEGKKGCVTKIAMVK